MVKPFLLRIAKRTIDIEHDSWDACHGNIVLETEGLILGHRTQICIGGLLLSTILINFCAKCLTTMHWLIRYR